MARVHWLASATTPALTEALAFATSRLRHAEDVQNTSQVIQIRALQALILYDLQRNEEAFDVLDRALALGEPLGFVRTLSNSAYQWRRYFGNLRPRTGILPICIGC